MRKLVLIAVAVILAFQLDAQALKVVPLVDDTTGNNVIIGGYYQSDVKMGVSSRGIILNYVEATVVPSANMIINQRPVQFLVNKSKAPKFYKALDSLFQKYGVPIIKDTIAVKNTDWSELLFTNPQLK